MISFAARDVSQGRGGHVGRYLTTARADRTENEKRADSSNDTTVWGHAMPFMPRS
jgi:hypothetical protein